MLKKGTRYLSLSIRAEEQTGASANTPAAVPAVPFNDEVPF